ncbi:ROK family transcriptional regulator [Vallitalea guaymasensis]|uniref:ROK family transcriptional regulator n=1 Tax=Vallitalea guaymasensis TaxID=1185412 RepID=UPI00235784C6|nr:ROK family transcriptional regulator [Vallitalea guaymasensis]
MNRIMNNERMKIMNEQAIFTTIHKEKYISRKGIADITGLTKASVTNIVNKFINHGYLVEKGMGQSTGGRKPVMVTLNSESCWMIGLTLDTQRVSGIITNLSAEKKFEYSSKINNRWSKEEILNVIFNVIKELLVYDREHKIIGIGLAMPGPYNHEKGELLDLPNFKYFKNILIRDIIEKEFQLPTFMEKETQAAALGEYLFGEVNESKNIFVLVVNYLGIGGGVLLNGKSYRGFADGAGDVGHMIIDRKGPKCSCGKVGCFEALANGVHMYNEVTKAIENKTCNAEVPEQELKIAEYLHEKSLEEDRFCNDILDREAEYLSIGITNIIQVFSPQTIILGGDIILGCPTLHEKVLERVRKNVYPLFQKDIDIKLTSFGQNLLTVGGASLVIQEFYNRNPKLVKKEEPSRL